MGRHWTTSLVQIIFLISYYPFSLNHTNKRIAFCPCALSSHSLVLGYIPLMSSNELSKQKGGEKENRFDGVAK